MVYKTYPCQNASFQGSIQQPVSTGQGLKLNVEFFYTALLNHIEKTDLNICANYKSQKKKIDKIKLLHMLYLFPMKFIKLAYEHTK